MSDDIYKWARRELDAIRLGDHDLDLEHLSALARIAADKVDEAVVELAGLTVEVKHELEGMPWVSIRNRGIVLAEGRIERPGFPR